MNEEMKGVTPGQKETNEDTTVNPNPHLKLIMRIFQGPVRYRKTKLAVLLLRVQGAGYCWILRVLAVS